MPWRTRRLAAVPAEFISLIANAGMVITDSFHATIFSLIFHRPFCRSGMPAIESMSMIRALGFELSSTSVKTQNGLWKIRLNIVA